MLFFPLLLSVFASYAVTIALTALAFSALAKPKQPNTVFQDLEEPKASAGSPIPVVFGTVTMKTTNVIFTTEKTTRKYKVS